MFSAVAVVVVYFLYWLVPWSVTHAQHAIGPSERVNPTLRRELRAQETRMAVSTPASDSAATGLDPCLHLPAPDASSAAEEVNPGGRVGDCLLLVPDGRNMEEEEVNLRTGMLVIVRTDLVLSGAPTIAFTRVVRPPTSSLWPSNASPWSDYDILPGRILFPYRSMSLRLPDSTQLQWRRVSKEMSYADAVFESIAGGSRFGHALAGWNGAGWDVDLPDGTTYVFPDSYTAGGLRQSALSAVLDPSGARLTLERDSDGNLQSIDASDGRRLQFFYQDGDLRALSDSSGQQVRYSYDPQGRLYQTTDSLDHVVNYAYTGEKVTGMLGAHGSSLLKATYDSAGRISMVSLTNGAAFRLRYETDFTGEVIAAEVLTDEGGWRVRIYDGAYAVHQLNTPMKRGD